MVWVVDKSCEFIVLPLLNNTTTTTISRGTQQGMLQPGDSCQAWNKYDTLELDSKMIATRVSAALSIVCGAVSLVLCLVWLQWPLRWIRFVGAFLALCVAVFQALTHLMVKSDFCGPLKEFWDNSNDQALELIFDDCDKATPAYNLTFATMGLYAIAGPLIVWALRLSTEGNDDDSASDTMPKKDDQADADPVSE